MSIERVSRKGGAVWRVRWRDELGRERSKVLGRKADAQVFDAEITRSKRIGSLPMLDAGQETLGEFVERWWALYAVTHFRRTRSGRTRACGTPTSSRGSAGTACGTCVRL